MGLLNSLGPALRSLVRRHRLTLGHQRSPWTSLWRQPVSMALRMPWPVFFLRFTKVDAPLRFSSNLCLSCSPGGHLSCRFVTGDPTYWLRVSDSMVLFLDEEIEAGVVQRRLHSLPLLQLHHYRIDDILEGHVFDDLDALHRTRLIGGRAFRRGPL
jgi:hypothetical protein